jgi:Flp pilus assembly protein TadB
MAAGAVLLAVAVVVAVVTATVTTTATVTATATVIVLVRASRRPQRGLRLLQITPNLTRHRGTGTHSSPNRLPPFPPLKK